MKQHVTKIRTMTTQKTVILLDRAGYLTVKEIETKLAEHHLARTDSTTHTVRRSGLFCFQPVMLTQVQHG